MNPAFFGDSYDIVKRFFCGEVSALGYFVVVEPMLTGDWNGGEAVFLRFIGASPSHDKAPEKGRTALFFDPDTGVHRRASMRHVAIARLAEETARYDLVFSFDQSFARQAVRGSGMRDKLVQLSTMGISAMYYDSHARFLFVSRVKTTLAELRNHLVQLGMPPTRFVTNGN